MAALLSSNTNLAGVRPSAPRRVSRAALVRTQAQAQGDAQAGRRAALASIAGAAASLAAAPAFAAYGDSANVFGKATNTTGFVQYVGDGFSVLVPSRWNPSRERDFKNMILRYEDNADAINFFGVIAEPTTKSTISDYGSTNDVLKLVSYLLGQQSFSGDTVSEGGFAPGRVAAASVLDITEGKDKKGNTFYAYDILTRTADGDEGGKHQLIKATVSGGKLWLLKVQVGDKRWFKGVKKDAIGVFDSFNVL